MKPSTAVQDIAGSRASSQVWPLSRPLLRSQIVGLGDTALTAALTVIVTSAMFAAAAIRIFEIDRSVTLFTQYAIWAIAAAVAMLARSSLNASYIPSRSPVVTSMACFVTALVASTLFVWKWGDRLDVSSTFLQVAALAYMCLPFFVFDYISKRVSVDGAIIVTCHVISVICMMSILGDLTGLTAYESYSFRHFGFMSDPAAWALTFPLIVYFSTNRFLMAGFVVLGLLFTASRGPALMVCAAFALLFVFSRGRRLQYIATLTVILAILVIQSDQFGAMIGRISSTQVVNDRLFTSINGLQIFSASPLFGSGYNSLAYYYPSIGYAMKLGEMSVATSSFVQMLSDGGLLLFVPFFLFVVTATIGAIALLRHQQGQTSPGPIGGVCAWIVAALWVNQTAAWFLVGSYIAPLMFGAAGIVSGYWSRLRSARPSPVQDERYRF